MKKFFKKKIIATLFIIVVILFLSVKNIKLVYEPIKDVLKEHKFSFSNMDELINDIEEIVNTNFYGRNEFINIYGYAENILDKKRGE